MDGYFLDNPCVLYEMASQDVWLRQVCAVRDGKSGHLAKTDALTNSAVTSEDAGTLSLESSRSRPWFG
jgi:hypothetical protein